VWTNVWNNLEAKWIKPSISKHELMIQLEQNNKQEEKGTQC
jgi:hypothetical protein